MRSNKPQKIKSFFANGYWVEIFDDGTKKRTATGHEVLRDEITPESVDLKITDYCTAGCAFCHESSTKRGVHGDVDFINRILLDCKGEVAIGGGDPLSHPDFEDITNHYGNVICNVTVNERNFYGKDGDKKFLRLLRTVEKRHVYGVGVSIDPDVNRLDREYDSKFEISRLLGLPNAVGHVIAGVHNPLEVENLEIKKLLILGYKDFGFGIKYRKPEVEEKIRRMRYYLPRLLDRFEGCYTAFDNLAIEQMKVREIIDEPTWDSFYMGDDGHFTMYIDAVKQEFAKSSTSPRQPCGNLTLNEMFAIIRQGAGA